ncbi:DUF3850 domain-containing protein [Cronobacter malonaticus]|uniref:DUF3850 domain-containing protein n=1 Tax=Cronobacter malonaticus TaxID=413503 RepID=UPI000CFBF92D
MSEIREPVTHNLKIWSEHYSAVCAGVKRAELRKNDRDYRAGDTLDLCEWDKDDESFTGEFISVTVTHVADVGEWMPGYVLLSIERTLRERAEPDGYRKLFTCSSCGAEGLDEPLESRCHCNGDGARWIEGRLYTAPPATVVSKIDRKAICNKAHWLCARSPGATFYNAAEFALDEVMELLAPPASVVAEPVSQPYKLPEGWIACSEQMPENGGLYLCYVQDEYEFDISYFCFEYLAAHKKFDSAGLNITHWMPLPAAPGKN